MTVETTRTMYGWLASSSAITSLVSKPNIRLAYPKLDDSFPCISLIQAAGSNVVRLGYKTATAGTKSRRENMYMQVDIWSKNGYYQVDSIGDEVEKVMASGGATKQSDNHDHDDGTGLYRKIMMFSYINFHDD